MKLQRTVGRSKHTPVLGSTNSVVNGHVQSRIGKENDSSILPFKRSKASVCVGKENDPVLSSKKSKVSSCFQKENNVTPISKVSKASPSVGKENEHVPSVSLKRSKPSSELVCSSESPNKKQKQVLRIYKIIYQ